MKIHRSKGYVHIDFTFAEARVLLEELSDVRGGSRMPKVRQICQELSSTLALITAAEEQAARAAKWGPRGSG